MPRTLVPFAPSHLKHYMIRWARKGTRDTSEMFSRSTPYYIPLVECGVRPSDNIVSMESDVSDNVPWRPLGTVTCSLDGQMRVTNLNHWTISKQFLTACNPYICNGVVAEHDACKVRGHGRKDIVLNIANHTFMLYDFKSKNYTCLLFDETSLASPVVQLTPQEALILNDTTRFDYQVPAFFETVVHPEST